MWRYVRNVLLALDFLANALLGGNPRKTISQRLGLWLLVGGWRARVAKPICWALDLLHPGHCNVCLDNDDYDTFRKLRR